MPMGLNSVNRTAVTKPDITIWVIIWLIIIFFGPYVHFGISFRIDHLLLPILFLASLYIYVKKGKFVFLPVYMIPLLLFLIIVTCATLATLKTGEYPFHLSFGLGDFENHLRIVMYGFIFWIVSRFYEIRLQTILLFTFWMGVILSLFGILQTITTGISVVDQFIWDLSLMLYEGQHIREKGAVELCLRIRAMSTFYTPGNFGLFLGLVCCFYCFYTELFSMRKFYNIAGFFILVTAGIFTISKVFLGFYLLVLAGMLWRKAYLKCLVLLLIFVISFLIVGKFNPYATHVYKINIKSVLKPVMLYNTWLGSRFGKIPEVQETKSEWTDLPAIVTGKTELDTSRIGTGYLDDYPRIIENHPIIGVGYVLVKSGDSMLNHLVVRGGGLGALCFLLFLFFLSRRLFSVIQQAEHRNSLRNAFTICFAGFLIGGVAFPTFIQDRSTDAFWIVSFIVSNRESLKSDKYSR